MGCILVLLYGLGVTVRRVVLEAHYSVQKTELSFTLESALAYRLVDQVCRLGTLPEIDQDIEYPEGINVRETYSIGSEYVYSFLAKFSPHPSL